MVNDRLRVTVAAWGPSLGYPHFSVFEGEQFADQGPELGYEARARVEILAASTATLGNVIDEAAERFGVRSRSLATVAQQVACVAFFCEGDDSGMDGRPDRWWHA